VSKKTQNILFTVVTLITGISTAVTGIAVTYAGGLGLKGLITKDYAFEFIPEAKAEAQPETITENN